MSITEKLLKNTTIADTALLTESKIYGKKDMIPTSVPLINIALSASPQGGLTPGLTIVAGPSKHFKSMFSILLANAFLQKYPKGAILFYDSEFGTPESYFDNFEVPKDQIVHTPILDVEQMKHDLTTQLTGLERGDEVLILCDSIGGLASRKESADALKSDAQPADYTRAKALKSMFRIAGPHLSIKDIPLVAVNHTYKDMASLYPTEKVGGGTGPYYHADTIWIIGRRQDKDKNEKELKGYEFVINIEKSRYVKEKAKFPLYVGFDEGIYKWSGLLELGLFTGTIVKTDKLKNKAPLYSAFGKTFTEKEGEKEDGLWEELVANVDFQAKIKQQFALGN